ncbi:hypothetical protein TRM7557_01897 [Tritonibacter multivorans]|uniref:Uncharacterized protein n=1 Tax=Tritonibacter multivorans TaxID=928856 RepID=A0A0P1GS19_9RHOB|nr:hypothetical protein [Tritonibacter multivorans]MDA7422099.1 hypothetical protein [Tritonibacter multivorans]CUH78472.1 hypothetical protein TRM7557_01897 [Tritonibacter multivorans]SFD17363.1 hypothetical protein SAMN04488049_10868 [Tritonibacter multivorans]
MATAERERKSQRLFWALISALILGYAVIKARHIAVALEAYDSQPLTGDTTGAAK